MQKLIIKGSKQLSGTVRISGAKNAALPVLAATLLADGEYRLENVPSLRDISTMRKLLEQLDITNEPCGESCYKFTNNGGSHFEAPYELVNTMRASILVLGPLLAKRGKARVSLPGGCAIGARPVDLHITALEKMGAKIDVSHGYIEAECSKLQGTEIFFDKITVTGTENIMMAATLAQGNTVLHNAAAEPEVCDLANFLRSMGAKISGDGTHTIVIEGVECLSPACHFVMPDRIEAGTFLCALLATGGNLTVENIPVSSMDAVFAALTHAGLKIETLNDLTVKASSDGRPRATDITTQPYPGFPTDMQAQFMAAMTAADGASVINETIFENRFMHVAELKRMGADITVNDGTATVRGVEKLSGAPVMASDLRASAGLVIAALIADNTSELHRVYHLDRGYDAFDKKLSLLGASVERADANQ
jgi:UDP-N-acetylglucosamine 1-carboxyvinyltransferase